MLLLITGIMASGKTTVAQAIAERLPKCVHLDGDIFRRMIVTGRVEMASGAGEEAFSQLRLRYRMTADAARSYHEAGFHVVIQDNYYCEMLPYMVSLLEGLPLQVAVLCPSVEAVTVREAKRQRKGYTGYEIEPLWRSFMEGTPRIGYWLDNSDITAEEAADRILKEVYGI
ncbi:MAG: AAA family ATPase [Christensenellales bacterium]|jgi:chloramphenicol 3-O-phosphotransferase